MKSINNIQLKNNTCWMWVLLVLFTFGFSSCDKDMEGKIYQVSDEMMMDEIMEANADLSDFLQIVDLSGLRGTVHAYGTYTFFVPDNNAVSSYLKDAGKTLSSLTKEEAEKIVKYHLVPDTISTTDFVDGRLNSKNFNNQYVTTKTVVGGYVINRQANIVEKDLRGSNGYIHVIDNVLSHSTKTIDETISDLPETYSLWKEVYELSGVRDTFINAQNINPDTVFTCFIQDNDAFKSIEITNVEELLAELRVKTPAVTDDIQLMNNFIRYHIAPDISYVTDLMNQNSLKTLVPSQVIVLKRNADKVILNEFEIGGVLEEGVEVNRADDNTDLSCLNGVVHTIKGNIQIVNRSAYRVYWEITEQPEFMALKGFRKPGSVSFKEGELSNIKWGHSKSTSDITYYCGGMPSSINKDNNYTYGDRITWRFDTNTSNWVEFTLPVLVPGTYKVWFTFRASSDSQEIRTYFKQEGQDDQALGLTLMTYNREPKSYGLTDYNDEFFQKALIDGYRCHMATSKFANTANVCQYMGSIVVATTGQHVLRMEATKSRWDTGWDQILFIPIDEDQVWPQQDAAGKLIYATTPACEVYPYTTCVDPEEPGEGGEE